MTWLAGLCPSTGWGNRVTHSLSCYFHQITNSCACSKRIMISRNHHKLEKPVLWSEWQWQHCYHGLVNNYTVQTIHMSRKGPSVPPTDLRKVNSVPHYVTLLQEINVVNLFEYSAYCTWQFLNIWGLWMKWWRQVKVVAVTVKRQDVGLQTFRMPE